MSGQDLIFVLIAVVSGLAAIGTVTAKNLVHAALFLAVALSGIAGVFLVMHAEFVALVQLVVYVGAIAVLFLFGLMLTRAPIGREALDSQHRGLGIAIAGTLFVVLTTLIIQSGSEFVVADQADVPTIAETGTAIFKYWVFPFEVLSMLLLAALVGTIVLARRESGESGEEAPYPRIELSEGADEAAAAEHAAEAAGRLAAGGGDT